MLICCVTSFLSWNVYFYFNFSVCSHEVFSHRTPQPEVSFEETELAGAAPTGS